MHLISRLSSRLSSLGRDLYDRVAHRDGHSPASEADPAIEPRAAAVSDAAAGDIDARTDAEIAQDLARLDEELPPEPLDIEQLSEGDDAQVSVGATMDVAGAAVGDSGDLYGAHIPPASDRDQVDDDEAFDSGQNWVEALETTAAEGGPAPEQELDVVDENDIATPSSDSRDRPIADRGSGGPSGL